jgi:hypothetical protein
VLGGLDLKGNAFRLALETPPGWETKLFAEVLMQAVAEVAEPRAAHRLGIAFGAGRSVEGLEGLGWMLERGKDFVRLAEACTALNESLQLAMGPPGSPGDVPDLVLVARQFGSLYRALLEVSEEVRRAHYDEPLIRASKMLAAWGDDIIAKLEGAGPMIIEATDQGLASSDSDRHIVLDMEVAGDAESFWREMDRIFTEYGGRG